MSTEPITSVLLCPTVVLQFKACLLQRASVPGLLGDMNTRTGNTHDSYDKHII